MNTGIGSILGFLKPRIGGVTFTIVLCCGILAHSASRAAGGGAALMTGTAEWKISKIEAPGNRQSESYCAMTRKFTKDVVLNLGSRANGDLSLAFDFQKKSFDLQKDYVVALSAGKETKRAFSVRPVSEAAIVLSAGQDPAFLQALAKKGKIDANIAGKIYVFDLGPVSAGIDKLKNCVAELKDSAGPAIASARDDAKTAPLTPDVESLLKANARPSSEGGTSGEAPAPKTSAATTASASSSSRSGFAEIEALREENLRLSNALERERRTYENREMGGAEGNLVAELREKIALLESRQVKPSESQKAPDDTAARSLKESEDKMRALKDENARLKTEIERTRTAAQAQAANIVSPKAFDDVRAQLDSLRTQNETLKAQLEQERESAPPTPANVSAVTHDRSMQIKLDEASKKLTSLQTENAALREEKERKLLRLSSDDWNLEEATRRYNEAEREIRRMALLVEENKSICAQEKVELEGMLFDPSVADQEQLARLSGLENKLRAAQAELQAQRDSHEKQIEELRRSSAAMNPQEVAKRDSRIQELEGELRTIRTDIEKALEERDTERTKTLSLSREVEELKARLEGKADVAQQNLSRLDSEKKTAMAQLAQLTEDKNRIVRERDEALARFQGLSADKARLESEVARLSANQSAGASPEEKAALGRELMALRAENVRKDTEYTQKVARLEAEKAHIAAALAQIQQAKTQTPPVAMAPSPSVAREIEGLRAELQSTQKRHEQEIAALRGEVDRKTTTTAQHDEASAFASLEPAAGTERGQDPVPLSSSARVSAVQSATLPAPVQTPAFMNLAQISGVLEGAGLKLSKPVEKVAEVSGPAFSAYRWQIGPAFGSSEQRPLGDIQQFDRHIQDYVNKTQSRCPGEFAASPAASRGQGLGRIESYEIACVGNGSGSSAAIVFFVRKGLFTVIAHESGTDAMDVAMEDRDRIFSSLSQDAALAAR